MSALLLDDALKPATPLTNGAINQTLRPFAPLIAPELPLIVNIDKPSMKDPLKLWAAKAAKNHQHLINQ